MKPELKQIIAIFGLIFILTMIFYGSYLPYQKSKSFISAMQAFQRGEIKNIDDFFKNASKPLDTKSPIGQEEITKQFVNYFSGLISQNNNSQITDFLMNYIKKYYEPILEKGRALSFNQYLYSVATLNLTAYNQTKNENYFKEAKKYFELSYGLAPKRPQSLYGMFDICQIEKNKECIKKFGEEILSYWDDPEVKKIINSLEKD